MNDTNFRLPVEVNVRLTQQEFDEMPGIVVHLILDDGDPPRALCSGEVVDPSRWLDDTKTIRKQCQACFRAAQRQMRSR